MCRWITLMSSGDPVLLSDIILSPSNSLIQLSKDASFHPEFGDMNNHVTNGDGFGVGWYHTNTSEYSNNQVTTTTTTNNNNSSSRCNNNHPSDDSSDKKKMLASVFKDTQPAWNNANLRELCMAVKSNCMIAHVRAASVFAGISQQNCHPFKAGRLLFCHNGRIGNFNLVRRKFHYLLSNEAYTANKGTTDSETLFHLLCTFLSEDGWNMDESAYQQTAPFGSERLTNAVKKVYKTITNVLEDSGSHDNEFSTLNFALTDGETVVVTRFCDKSPIVPPPSLYFAFGDGYKIHEELVTDEQVPEHIYKKQESSIPENSAVDDDDETASLDDDGGAGLVSEDDNNNNNNNNNTESFNEKSVPMNVYESKPGTIYSDVDVDSASFIVASCPLTKTHTWHPMPKNSIMWYTKGSLPQLRVLKRKDNKRGGRDRQASFALSTSFGKSFTLGKAWIAQEKSMTE